MSVDISLGLRYGKAKHRTHDRDYAHHLPGLLWQMLGDSGIIIVKHASQQSHQAGSPSVASPRPPAPVLALRVEKERRTKTRSIVKPEKAALVPGTALGNTGPVPVYSRQ